MGEEEKELIEEEVNEVFAIYGLAKKREYDDYYFDEDE